MNSKRKGCVGERELASVLREYGLEAQRGQQFKGSADSPDIVTGGVLSSFHIECKRVEKLNLENAMQQSIRDSEGRKIPTVMHRKNRGEWLVTMRLSDWVNML